MRKHAYVYAAAIVVAFLGVTMTARIHSATIVYSVLTISQCTGVLLRRSLCP